VRPWGRGYEWVDTVSNSVLVRVGGRCLFVRAAPRHPKCQRMVSHGVFIMQRGKSRCREGVRQSGLRCFCARKLGSDGFRTGERSHRCTGTYPVHLVDRLAGLRGHPVGCTWLQTGGLEAL
jgi:hypothetical protein